MCNLSKKQINACLACKSQGGLTANVKLHFYNLSWLALKNTQTQWIEPVHMTKFQNFLTFQIEIKLKKQEGIRWNKLESDGGKDATKHFNPSKLSWRRLGSRCDRIFLNSPFSICCDSLKGHFYIPGGMVWVSPLPAPWAELVSPLLVQDFHQISCCCCGLFV